MKLQRVTLLESVIHVLINAAVDGYEASYKEERLGILLGRTDKNIGIVEHATLYRGGHRTRSEAGVDCDRFTRRVHDLVEKHQLQFLGTFHTHNEIAGRLSSRMSLADRNHLCEDPPHLVELIALVWASNHASRPTQRYIQGQVGGYRFRIAGYQMYPPYSLIPVYTRDAS